MLTLALVGEPLVPPARADLAIFLLTRGYGVRPMHVQESRESRRTRRSTIIREIPANTCSEDLADIAIGEVKAQLANPCSGDPDEVPLDQIDAHLGNPRSRVRDFQLC